MYHMCGECGSMFHESEAELGVCPYCGGGEGWEADMDDEDDGQPSEYDEWQDYMGGDEYYDHSEMCGYDE